LSLLPRFDDDLASQVREGGCPRCGGRLDVADYPRKPRGGSIELGDDYDVRRSFCCAVEGCRRRRTPPSDLDAAASGRERNVRVASHPQRMRVSR